MFHVLAGREMFQRSLGQHYGDPTQALEETARRWVDYLAYFVASKVIPARIIGIAFCVGVSEWIARRSTRSLE